LAQLFFIKVFTELGKIWSMGQDFFQMREAVITSSRSFLAHAL